MALISAPRTLVGGGALLLEESPSIRCAQPSPDWQQKALVRPRLARQHGSIGKIHVRFNLLVLACVVVFLPKSGLLPSIGNPSRATNCLAGRY